ncbi:MAG: response regulator [Chitinophagaceae bacterium]
MQRGQEQKKIRIILVDDHKAIRDSWKALLEQDNRFLVVEECEDGSDAIQAAHRLIPDIILMDINMKHVNGFEATKKISESLPSVKIIGLSVNNHPGYAAKMLSLGARGFVTKSSPFSELTNAILKVQEGKNYLCEEIKKYSGNGQII